ncbi:hypothetical protein WJX72_006101 [[Myrmecia] bisecta]|uniref:Uncharacterized protein n=1 Tax=[Myrmecia] bisecta TaxID=41462 RepID=A0AAW1P0E6_9CHLO
MLVLAVHTVSAVTAKVPFGMIMLMDHIQKKEVPQELRCRQVHPTSGLRSTSLWDVPSVAALQEWLDEFLDVDCQNEVFEIQEEFAYGISVDLSRARTAEMVSANTRATAAAVNERTKAATAAASKQMTELDQKYHVSEQAERVAKAAREASTAAAARTAAMFGRVGTAAKAAQSKALENEKVAAAATSLNSGMTSSWKSLTQGVAYLKAQVGRPGEGGSYSPMASTSDSGEAAAPRRTGEQEGAAAPAVTASKGSGSEGYEGLAMEARAASHTAGTAHAAHAAAPASMQSTAPPPAQAPPPPQAVPEDKSLFTLDDLESDDEHNGPTSSAVGQLHDLHLSPPNPRAAGGFGSATHHEVNK